MIRGTKGKIMDNFHFIEIKPTIDRAHTASIKEAILKRAKEKSNALAEEKSENYVAQVQEDVMNIAKDSIKSSPINPFNQFKDSINSSANKIRNEISQSIKEVETKSSDIVKEEPVREIKRNIESASNSTFVNSVKEETMNAARNQFRQGTNLNTILNFLNTQAAIKMAEKAHSKINFVS